MGVFSLSAVRANAFRVFTVEEQLYVWRTIRHDFLTFFILLKVFHAHERLFVESLAIQTLVIFVIRTAGRPWRDRPSVALTASTLMMVATGILLPFSSLRRDLGFTPLPPPNSNSRIDSITMKNGKKADIPVAGMFELNDAGKIKVWRDYFDLATFTKQVS